MTVHPSQAYSPLAQRLRRDRRRVAIGYAALALGWLLASIGLVVLLDPPLRTALLLQAVLATIFVVASAVLLYLLLRPLGRDLLQAHARLASSELRHRELFNDNPGPTLVYELDTLQVLDANPAACQLFGWDHAGFVGLPISHLWPPGTERQLHDALAALRVDPGKACMLQARLQLRDGSTRAIELRSNPMNFGGRPARLLIAIDRTAEEAALQRRDHAVQRLQEAHAMARMGAWELDPVTAMGRYDDAIYRMLGRRPPEARRLHRFEELLVAADPATAALVEQRLADLCTGVDGNHDLLLPVLAMDGRALTLQLRARGETDGDGQRRVHGTLQDVTEREQSRRLMREREDQFRELVRVLPDGVVILHQEHVLYANAHAARLFGYGASSLLGEPLSALVEPADLVRARVLLHWPTTENAHAAPLADLLRMRRADGSAFQANLAVGDVRHGGRDCQLLIVRDLSESERIRQALAQSNEELQAMAGRLFSMQEDERRAISRDLHDDIGQAITAMKLSAWAAQDEQDPARRSEDLAQVVSLADSTVAKLRDLSTLLRPPQLDALGLEAALRWQAGVLFRASPVALLAQIDALSSRPDNAIEQACFRIAQESLTNALRHARASQVALQLHDLGDQRLRLVIEDDGEGFAPEAPRGLGLIVMRERAQSVGGQLQIESSPGAGTRIELLLPYHAPPAANQTDA